MQCSSIITLPSPPEFTTAEALGALRSELIAAGFDGDAAHQIVMAFVHESAESGFCVKSKLEATA